MIDSYSIAVDMIAKYDGLNVTDLAKIYDSADKLFKINFGLFPDLRIKVKHSIENALISMKYMSAEGDSMAMDGRSDAIYYEAAKRQGARPYGFLYNDNKPIAPEYWPLVRKYVKFIKDSPQDCINFLLTLLREWHQMYVRHHAFLLFSELTNSGVYANEIMNAVLREAEMDTRTPMLEWLVNVDYSENHDLVPYILKCAQELVENPCAGNVLVYIGNMTAIPEVRESAEKLVSHLQKYNRLSI